MDDDQFWDHTLSHALLDYCAFSPSAERYWMHSPTSTKKIAPAAPGDATEAS